MREHKYRAWHKTEKRMFTVYYLSWFDGIFLIGDDKQARFGSGEVELMEYTDLKDKQEKDIYEGDIVHSRFGIGWVQYFLGEWCVLDFRGWFALPREELEVIGNLYENPELLEQK